MCFFAVKNVLFAELLHIELLQITEFRIWDWQSKNFKISHIKISRGEFQDPLSWSPDLNDPKLVISAATTITSSPIATRTTLRCSFAVFEKISFLLFGNKSGPFPLFFPKVLFFFFFFFFSGAGDWRWTQKRPKLLGRRVSNRKRNFWWKRKYSQRQNRRQNRI